MIKKFRVQIPKEIVVMSDIPLLTKANLELDAIRKETDGFRGNFDDYSALAIDEGVVYEQVSDTEHRQVLSTLFVIGPLTEGTLTLADLIERWERMAAFPRFGKMAG